MSIAKAPIFIVEGLDVGVYESLDKAVRHIEAIDVANGAYVAYDSEGRLISLSTAHARDSFLSIDAIILTFVEEEPTHADELREKLKQFLLHVYQRKGRDTTAIGDAPLNELVVKALEFKTE